MNDNIIISNFDENVMRLKRTLPHLYAYTRPEPNLDWDETTIKKELDPVFRFTREREMAQLHPEHSAPNEYRNALLIMAERRVAAKGTDRRELVGILAGHDLADLVQNETFPQKLELFLANNPGKHYLIRDAFAADEHVLVRLLAKARTEATNEGYKSLIIRIPANNTKSTMFFANNGFVKIFTDRSQTPRTRYFSDVPRIDNNADPLTELFSE